MNQKETVNSSLSDLLIDKLDRVNTKIVERFGNDWELSTVLKQRPDLAFQSITLFLSAFLTIPTETLTSYSICLVKGFASITKHLLIDKPTQK